MNRLPSLSGLDVIKALEQLGFTHVRTKGSHAMLRDPTGRGVTVPLHRELKRGTLTAILRQTGVDLDDFVSVL